MVIPPEANGAFVAAMEEVLDIYTRPHDPDMPLVCLDETSKQLVSETRTPVPMKPGQPERVDYEYERNGTANLFMLFAPLEGFRHVEVTDHRKAVDYAKILKDLSDVLFPHARKIALVQDNLNTHVKASLYEAFPPAEARRLVERFEWNYTPKHGSWLNMAESELGILSSQCLNRRIPDKETLSQEVPPGRPAAMKTKPKRIGASQPLTPASSSSVFILGLNTATSLLCAKSGRVAQNWDDVATKKPRLDTRPDRHFLC